MKLNDLLQRRRRDSAKNLCFCIGFAAGVANGIAGALGGELFWISNGLVAIFAVVSGFIYVMDVRREWLVRQQLIDAMQPAEARNQNQEGP